MSFLDNFSIGLGPFSIGNSDGTTPGHSTSNSENFGSHFSHGGGSMSATDFGSDVWGPQQDYLTNLWAAGAANQGYQGNPQHYYGPGWNRSGSLSNPQRITQTNQTLGQLQGQPGVNPMLDVYSRQIGRQFAEQVMPAIEGGANLAGARGSSRQGIAEGLAAARSGQQIQDFAAQVYNQDQDRRLGAANVASQRQLGGVGNMSRMAGPRAALAMGAPWYDLQQMAGLIGSPIMQDLGSEQSSSHFSTGGGETYGYTNTESTGGSTPGGWSIGVGDAPGWWEEGGFFN